MKPSLGRAWRDGLRVCWKDTVTLPRLRGRSAWEEGRRGYGGERNGLVEAARAGEIQIAGTMCICIPLGDRQTILDFMPRQAVKQEDVSCDPMSILDLCSRYYPLVLRLYFISPLLSLCPSSSLGPTTRLPRRVGAGCVEARRHVSRGGLCSLTARRTGFTRLLTIGSARVACPVRTSARPTCSLAGYLIRLWGEALRVESVAGC